MNKVSNDKLQSVVGGTTVGPTQTPNPVINNQEIVSRAIAEIGKPFIWGGIGPVGYDASGLVSYCVTGTHTRIGTTATFMNWPKVNEPQPGDICVNSEHCGIYIGNHAMVHAPTFGQVVSQGPIQAGMIFVRYQ